MVTITGWMGNICCWTSGRYAVMYPIIEDFERNLVDADDRARYRRSAGIEYGQRRMSRCALFRATCTKR